MILTILFLSIISVVDSAVELTVLVCKGTYFKDDIFGLSVPLNAIANRQYRTQNRCNSGVF